MTQSLTLIRRYIVRDSSDHEHTITEDEIVTVYPAAGDFALRKVLDWLKSP